MKNLITSLLQYNPNDRIDWMDFFNHEVFEKQAKSNDIN